jgi:ferric-dicitrate binding protein FerR (iron transport regulator)
VGESVSPGAELANEEEGRIAVRSEAGHSFRLDVATRVRIISPVAVALDRGRVYVDSGLQPDPAAASLEIHTPFGIVREVGTQFEVRLSDDALRIRVREGSVRMDGDRGTYDVEVGKELRLDDRGVPTWTDLPPYGPEWDWLSRIVPVFDLEGSSARDFLEWVSRERGWTLQFADARVGRSAAQIVLRGSIEGLTLDEALAAVLPTCHMTHRVENGILVIEAVADGEAS